MKYSYCQVLHVRLFISLLFCSFLVVFPDYVYSAVKKTDLRILIDVSGSMKINDPQNLRTPSVKLLIGLIPNGTRAGIWTFGKYVNMQVKYGVVNKPWKARARQEAAKIHSRGLYTNIEDVLKKSTYDWKSKDLKTSRHIILLTDGMVDISKQPEINLKSRNRIIEEYLPKLKKAGVKIHTIALSQQADHELLKLLSVSTDGWYELIEDPKILHRVFLRIFEKSSNANALPLENNLFKVDKSIKDMTVLSFHSGKLDSKLITPSKKTITEKNKPDNMNWFHEDGYDLITISKPEVGDWKLDAPVDKDNRVLVVTNLTLSVIDIPNNVLLNQRIILKAVLQQKGKNIKNKNFLNLVKISAFKKSLNDPDMKYELKDDGKGLDKHAADGSYYSEFRSPLRSGVFELSVTAQGPTFKRQRQYIVNVFNGIANIKITDAKDNDPFMIEVIPHKGLLQDGSVDILYEINHGGVKSFSKNNDGHWIVEVPANLAGEKVSFTIKGLRQNNKSVEMQMERILPERIKQVEKNKLEDKPNKKEEIEHKSVEKDSGGWISVIIWVLVINVILGLIAAIIFFTLKKKREKNAIAEKQELQL
ncbi:hypothetical protein MNBD_GAMMA22-2011 [hydrothermal vent metagenome]|uniref:VWFA domain-containing protein n=1 Tax=hydrothermal vent metagenome TaxID=652676 RepID=A0A3B1AQC6_9ZZZZ